MSKIEMCPVCLSRSCSREFRAREMMFGLREVFTYCQCGDCGSLWLLNPPDEFSRYYPDEYYSMSSQEINPRWSLIHASAYRVWSFFPPELVDRLASFVDVRPEFSRSLAGLKLKKNSRIADVGSGEGALLCRMARSGFSDLVGIDPFIAQSSTQGPVRLHKGTLQDFGKAFDLIMFNHSLEHMANPHRELQVARECLNPGGTVIVRLPVLNEAWEEYGPNWVGLDPPRHMFVPTVDGLRGMAEAVGLKVRRTFFDSYALQFLGSERYLRDIPLFAPGDRTTKEREARETPRWKRRARSLNRAGRGDTAGFQLVPA